MDATDADGPLVFAGSASPRLTKEICGHLGVMVGQGEVLRFSEGTLFPRVLENVRGRRAYLVQSTVFPANDHFMELLFWIDALKRASALVEAADKLIERGARSVMAAVSHGVFAEGSMERFDASPIRRLITTDTIETQPVPL